MNSLRSLGRKLLPIGYVVTTAWLLLIASPGGDGAAALHAQTCQPAVHDPECAPIRKPTASISPHRDTTSSPTAMVRYSVSDAVNINHSTFSLRSNGNNQYPSITWVGYRSGSGSIAVSLDTGMNTVIDSVCNSVGQCAADTARIVYHAPPTQYAPTFAVSGPYSVYHNAFRPASPCPACVTAFSYSAPSYTSLDVPRSLSVGYSSATAAPMGYVLLQSMQTSIDTVRGYLLKLRRNDGSYVTFTSGTTELWYQASTAGRYSSTNIAGQFDASSLSTGAYKYTAEVTAAYTAGGGYNYYTSSDTVRVLVVNEADSPLGRGFSWLGIPRIVSVSDGVVLVPGDGSAAFFKDIGCNYLFCSYTPPDGSFSTLQRMWDPARYTLTGTDGSVIAFDSTGRPQTAEDRFGNQTTFAWDGYGRLAAVTDPAGKKDTVGYIGTGVGSLRTITDQPLSRTSTFVVDSSGHVKRIVMPGSDSVPAIKDAEYDASHRLKRFANALGAATDSVVYSSLGWVRSVRVHGPSVALPATTLVRSWLDTLMPAPSTGYDINHRWTPGPATTVLTMPTSATVTMAVSRFGSPISMVSRDPLGHTMESTRRVDEQGRAIEEIDSRFNVVRYGYTGSHLASIANGSDVQEFRYTSYDQVDSVLVNGTLVSKSFYSGAKVTLDSVYQGSSKSYYHWDSRGRPTSQTNSLGGVSTFKYQSSGLLNVDTVTGPTGMPYVTATSIISYDAGGRIVKSVGPGGLADSTAYDALNRAVLSRDAAGAVTLHGYNLTARRDSVTDARGNVHRRVTDHLGRDTLTIAPTGDSARFVYDSLGNLRQAWNRRKQSTLLDYDSVGRVTRRIAGTDTAWFAYDTSSNSGGPANRWVVARNGASTDTVSFDAFGRVSNATSIRSGTTLTVNWTYDLLSTGPRQLIWLKSGGTGDTINYRYDDFARLQNIGTPRAGPTAVGFGTSGNPDTVFFPTSATPSSRLAARVWRSVSGRPSWVDFSSNNASLARWSAFDTLDRTVASYSGVTGNVVARSLGYEPVGRLKTYVDSSHVETDTYPCIEYDDWGVTCISWGYEAVWTHNRVRYDTFDYDSVGNRKDRSASIGTGNRLTSFDGYSVTYDADGNVLKRKKGTDSLMFTWNPLGQLTQVVRGGTTTTYAYDAWGRRVKKVSGGTTTNYLLNGQVLLAELDASFSPVRSYTYWPGTDRPHSMKVSGHTYFYAYEEPGHVIALVDTAGAVANTYSYDPWGNSLAASENVGQPLRYTARELDTETELYYYRARYYDPAIARFISEDPIGLGGGINVYAYVGDDPVNRTDPTGMCFGQETTYYVRGSTIYTWITCPADKELDWFTPGARSLFNLNTEKIDLLLPKERKDVWNLLESGWQKGYILRVWSSYRTCLQQLKDWQAHSGTWPGNSWHQYQAAVDLVILHGGLRGNMDDVLDPTYSDGTLSGLANANRFKWGGDWTPEKDKRGPDYPHFQWKGEDGSNTLASLQAANGGTACPGYGPWTPR